MKTYENLDGLIKSNTSARAYLSALPEGIAEIVRQGGKKIRTADELTDFAERLIHEFI